MTIRHLVYDITDGPLKGSQATVHGHVQTEKGETRYLISLGGWLQNRKDTYLLDPAILVLNMDKTMKNELKDVPR